MIDPLSCLGVAANVIQVVDFGLRVLDKGKDLAQHGITDEQKHLRSLARDTERVCSELQQQLEIPETPSTGPEPAVLDVARRTKGIAVDLGHLLSGLSINNASDDLERPFKKQRMEEVVKVAKQTVKGVWKEKDVSRLKAKMLELQQDMVLRLLALQTTSLSALARSIDSIAGDLAAERKKRLTTYEKLLPKLGRLLVESTAGTEYNLDPDGLAILLHEYADQVRTIALCDRILKTLSFEAIQRRHEDIPIANQNTFKWVFEPQMTDFSDWASSKSGKYDYAAVKMLGKPGSGKSTLMKYIVSQPSTDALLRQWAGRDDLIVAGYYFWAAGTPLQQSQKGLLRTLLFNIIQQSPEWVHDLVPARFRSARSEKVPWTYKELHTTISAFARKSKDKVKLCLFIDGLDEYVGEHVDLIDLISSIADNPQIKVCVASRPWNVFTRAYHDRADGRLKVQDLTRSDITAFITDKLTQDPLFVNLRQADEEGCRQLIADFTNKAQGVFLWVYLVQRSLLRGLDNEDDLATLQRRLDAYPPSLDGYFQRMFERIESVYRKHSSRILLAALHGKTTDMSLWNLKCLEMELDNPDYAISISAPPSTQDAIRVFGCDRCGLDPSISTGGLAHLSRGNRYKDNFECEFMCNMYNEEQKRRAHRLLDARAADLLEVSSAGYIQFVHRTAHDFILNSGTQNELHGRAGADYDVGLSLARIALVEQKRRADDKVAGGLLPSIFALDKDGLVGPDHFKPYSDLFHHFETDVIPVVMSRGTTKANAIRGNISWLPGRVQAFRESATKGT